MFTKTEIEFTFCEPSPRICVFVLCFPFRTRPCDYFAPMNLYAFPATQIILTKPSSETAQHRSGLFRLTRRLAVARPLPRQFFPAPPRRAFHIQHYCQSRFFGVVLVFQCARALHTFHRSVSCLVSYARARLLIERFSSEHVTQYAPDTRHLFLLGFYIFCFVLATEFRRASSRGSNQFRARPDMFNDHPFPPPS